jgi:hypothetical protein
MFSRIRKRFTFANVVLTVALVFAMTGGAYAAKHYLITSTSQISPKVLKQLKGANGAPGAPGTPGTPGTTGLAGKEGPTGKEGAVGKEGTAGKEGKEGPEGKEGSPWTAGGTLPKGKTETGLWTLGSSPAGFARIAISFPIPLTPSPNPHEPAVSESHVHYIAKGAPAPFGCGSGTAGAPEAEPGNLCVYATALAGAEETPNLSAVFPTVEVPGANTTGAMMWFKVKEGAQGYGTWAVTAE